VKHRKPIAETSRRKHLVDEIDTVNITLRFICKTLLLKEMDDVLKIPVENLMIFSMQDTSEQKLRSFLIHRPDICSK